jgi:dGTPase
MDSSSAIFMQFTPFEEAVQKILHSHAYCRYFDKTQVVYLMPFDHVTRRGLHVQLVNNFAQALGRRLQVDHSLADLSLIEAIALGHDVGHPPFGHEGENYLSKICQRLGLGHFSHARQSCRLFQSIEPLNLPLEVLDGFLCHDGGLRSRVVHLNKRKNFDGFQEELQARAQEGDLDLAPLTIEGAIVKIADTVSYLGRDIEDALRLGLIQSSMLPWKGLGNSNQEFLQRVGEDILMTYKKERVLGFSEYVFQKLREIRTFNFEHIYWHPRLKSESKKIERSFEQLYQLLFEDWELRREKSYLWGNFLHSRSKMYQESMTVEQHLIDYIAGMTDRYFVELYERLVVPQKIEVPFEFSPD